jgi:hypothetical protein
MRFAPIRVQGISILGYQVELMSQKPSTESIRDEYLTVISRPNVAEEDVHQLIAKYPVLLPLWRPYQNTVFSKMPLGNQHVVDFAFGRRNTPGVTWHFIELCKPSDRLFTRSGDPTKELSHGLRQLLDWNSWFTENLAFLRRNFPYQELMNEIGLWARLELTLVIGRRQSVLDRNRPLMREISSH